MEIFIGALVLVFALSTDAFIAAFSYGIGKTKIPLKVIFILTIICSFTVGGALLLGDVLANYIPINITRAISFLVLLVVGIYKLFEHTGTENLVKLTTKESIIFGFAMSLDGLAAGFGVGLMDYSVVLVVSLSLVATFLFVYFGNLLGLKLSHRISMPLGKISGVLLIILALCRVL